MTVKYYYHSGFSVASGETLLVFDYWMGRQLSLIHISEPTRPY